MKFIRPECMDQLSDPPKGDVAALYDHVISVYNNAPRTPAISAALMDLEYAANTEDTAGIVSAIMDLLDAESHRDPMQFINSMYIGGLNIYILPEQYERCVFILSEIAVDYWIKQQRQFIAELRSHILLY